MTVDLAPRTDTPDSIADNGTRTIRIKRACNGCGEFLGDLDDRDVDEHGNVTDVRGECTNCRPLVGLEATGCRTWRLLPRDLSEVVHEVIELDALTAAYSEHRDGRSQFVGIRIGDEPGCVVARFGDWIIYHPDGRWTVHPAPTT